MKLKIISVQNVFGVSQKGKGTPYCMYQASRLAELNDITSANYNLVGCGFSSVDMPVSMSFYDELLAYFKNNIGSSHFLEIDLELSLDSFNNNIISGFIPGSISKPLFKK